MKTNKHATHLGRIKSDAKAAAARENGKLGGRPPLKRDDLYWVSGSGWFTRGPDDSPLINGPYRTAKEARSVALAAGKMLRRNANLDRP